MSGWPQSKSSLDDFTLTQTNERPRSQATLPPISDGIYHIKSYIADVYLTCPQDADSMIAVQQLGSSKDPNACQKVRRHLLCRINMRWATDPCSGLSLELMTVPTAS